MYDESTAYRLRLRGRQRTVEDDRYRLKETFGQHGPECRLLVAPGGLALLKAMALSQSLPHLIIPLRRTVGFEQGSSEWNRGLERFGRVTAVSTHTRGGTDHVR